MALPETSHAERETIARAMWVQLGRVAGEAFQLGTLLREEARIALPEDHDALVTLSRDGVILATAHLGNWEVGGAIARRAGIPLAGVYQALHNPLAERHLRRLRAPFYPAGLHSKGPDLGARLVALARSGAAVGLVADLREKRGIAVRFFGRPAFATPMPAMLARLSGRPLIAGAVMRTGGAHFRLLARPIEVPHTDDRERDIAVATQRIHEAFEEWIRAAPEQWMWTHRKWATSGTRPLTLRTTLFAEPDVAPGGARRRCRRARLGVWSRSVMESAKLAPPHFGSSYGPGTPR